MRVDQLLVHRQLASTRSQAQRLIADGVQWLSGDVWKRVAKNGDEVPESAEIRLLDDSEARYVSRGSRADRGVGHGRHDYRDLRRELQP